jgi:hypothetical protein
MDDETRIIIMGILAFFALFAIFTAAWAIVGSR